MSFENRLDVIPNYIRAQSLEGLRSLMLKNNMRLKAHVKYRDIQFFIGGTDDKAGKGYWIAWYDEPIADILTGRIKELEVDDGTTE